MQNRREQYIYYLRNVASPKTRSGSNLSLESVKSYLSMMDKITNGLIKNGFLSRNQTIFDIDNPSVVNAIYQDIMYGNSDLSIENSRCNRSISSAIKHFLDMLTGNLSLDEFTEMVDSQDNSITDIPYLELLKKLESYTINTIPGPSPKIYLVKKRIDIVKAIALKRAQDKCDNCGHATFLTKSNKMYFECHHVDPLSKDGPDDIYNVVSLCPNCHRMVHYGLKADIQNANKHLLNVIEHYLDDSSIRNSRIEYKNKFLILKKKAKDCSYIF